jgi:hypothetical protein
MMLTSKRYISNCEIGQILWLIWYSSGEFTSTDNTRTSTKRKNSSKHITFLTKSYPEVINSRQRYAWYYDFLSWLELISDVFSEPLPENQVKSSPFISIQTMTLPQFHGHDTQNHHPPPKVSFTRLWPKLQHELPWCSPRDADFNN